MQLDSTSQCHRNKVVGYVTKLHHKLISSFEIEWLRINFNKYSTAKNLEIYRSRVDSK